MSNGTDGKCYIAIFNDLSDPTEVGDETNWEEGTLAYSIDIDALFVRHGNDWELVSTQVA